MYYLFIWDQYYPLGGFNDFVQSSNSLDAIKDDLFEYLKESHFDHYQIIQITESIGHTGENLGSSWNVVEEK